MLQRHCKVTTEFLCKINRHSGVDTALTVEELRMVVEGHDRAMPDIRMDVEPSAAVTPETGKPLRSHIIPRQGKRHGETLAVQRPEQLTAIG